MAYYAKNTGDCDHLWDLCEKSFKKLLVKPLDVTCMSPKGSSEGSKGLKKRRRGECRIISDNLLRSCGISVACPAYGKV
jgi:hypothetical protein